MTISFKARATSQNFNNAFVSKTSSDIKVGLLGLKKIDIDPNEITDVQSAINQNTKAIVDSLFLENLDLISISEISIDQLIRVKSLTGNITANTTPFGTVEPPNGTRFDIINQSTGAISFSYSDEDFGFLLNGDATLELYNSISIIYDKDIKRYIELSRNF